MQLRVENVSYAYMPGGPFEAKALQGTSVSFASGAFHACVGHTGSGKSTLLQLLNGLLRPQEGTVYVGDWTITPETKQKHIAGLRRKAGVVFQFPEAQLFDETVIDDVMYGPKNLGFKNDEARRLAEEALARTGISTELFTRSPFDLSGGQMRRAAIAGVLAMEPELLLLDEPTAGLDPAGRESMMELFRSWQQEQPERTIVMISHDMNAVARYADTVTVMEDGKAIAQKAPHELFTDAELLERHQLEMPDTVRLLYRLREASGVNMDISAFDEKETFSRILALLKGGVQDA
ncbi:energy-coupling factor transporter ATPase [Alkalicoccus luteus]|uniref:Energy-coupling factor transporter ATP-binding protein EcfA2 n=1 Tax=Alkalicoccus luteus TaxID=1237094 RepID=A0A969PR57_9BACI|nr:energy-coupling factor transporter ATPase [Alkalicoccus luteus]